MRIPRVLRLGPSRALAHAAARVADAPSLVILVLLAVKAGSL